MNQSDEFHIKETDEYYEFHIEETDEYYEFHIEETDEYYEAEMSFKNGELHFAACESHSFSAHTFSKANTEKLYQAMKEYYNN